MADFQFDALSQKIDEMIEKVQDPARIEKINRMNAKTWKKQLKLNMPQKNGHILKDGQLRKAMKDDIVISKDKDGLSDMILHGGKHTYMLWHLVNNGTSEHQIKGFGKGDRKVIVKGMAPHNFIEKTENEVQNKVKDDTANEIKKIIRGD